MAYEKLKACRICGNTELVEVLDLGEQALTGYFPSRENESVPSMPLKLIKCHGGKDVCHLLQLSHTFELDKMYGEDYGYRSGLNETMVMHLSEKVAKIRKRVRILDCDLVLDIGSNDGTTLGFYPESIANRVGVDPTGKTFESYYAAGIKLLPDFFSKKVFKEAFGQAKAKVITSFSMFYDLPDPVGFAIDIASVLDEQGIWVLEQSYMPRMLRMCSYDTVCHEHLEYYGLRQLHWIAEQAGLQVIDVEFNDINGGSFSVVVAHHAYDGKKDLKKVSDILNDEEPYQTLEPYINFAEKVDHSRHKLLSELKRIRASGKTVVALGASTKGNVILQYCSINSDLVPVIAEVNADKYGKFSPGTRIPIQPEAEVLKTKPDYLLILPWHFRTFFESSERFKPFGLIYPLYID